MVFRVEIINILNLLLLCDFTQMLKDSKDFGVFKIYLILVSVYACVSLYICKHTYVGPWRASDPLEL